MKVPPNWTVWFALIQPILPGTPRAHLCADSYVPAGNEKSPKKGFINRNRPREEPGCYALLIGFLTVDPGIKTAGGIYDGRQ